jgi:GT2 family glycosyltransferase
VKVAPVVLAWNGRDDTLLCLQSLERALYRPLDTIVVDNASHDGTPEAVESEHPSVTVVRNDRNLGFAGGMNVGIRCALERGADAVLTLNNDMVVDEAFVEPLVAALEEHAGAAAACSQILFADDPPRVWYAGARYDGRRGYQGRHTAYGRPPLPPTVPAYETDRACGGAMLATRIALETVGLFDEDLFAYGEDTDWSLRASRAGLQLLVVPASVVRHRVSASTGGESSPATLYYDLRNGIAVAERHVPLGGAGTLRRRAVAVAAHVAQALLSRRRRAGLRAVLQAYRDVRSGRLGPRPERGATRRRS